MIKFTAANRPVFVTQEVLTGPSHRDGLTFGDFLSFRDGGNDRIQEGDYIIQDDAGNPIGIIRLAEAIAQQERIRIEVGKELIRDIWRALDQTSDVMKASLTTTIIATIVACQSGQVRAAREIANGTPTGGAFTAQRKTLLLNLIDEAITKL